MKKMTKKKATAPKRKLKRGVQSDFLPPSFRSLMLPELWCKIEVPVSVRFMEAMRVDDAASLGDGRKRPARLARIYDMQDGSTKDLALPERLAAVFAVLPLDGYVGRAFSILRHRRAERKNAAGYTVAEIVEKPAA